MCLQIIPTIKLIYSIITNIIMIKMTMIILLFKLETPRCKFGQTSFSQPGANTWRPHWGSSSSSASSSQASQCLDCSIDVLCAFIHLFTLHVQIHQLSQTHSNTMTKNQSVLRFCFWWFFSKESRSQMPKHCEEQIVKIISIVQSPL